MEQQQSFYSIDNSRSEFTFIEQPKPKEAPPPSLNLLQKFDIRQSSAVQLQALDLLNKSFSSVPNRSQEINLNDISAINQNLPNQLECSLCLQNQIDCLSIPLQPSPQEIENLQNKISTLKNTQALLQKQIEAIHLAQSNGNNFMKKQCKHAEDAGPSRNTQVGVKSIQEEFIEKDRKQQRKHFDIKPNRTQTPAQKEANVKYKQCSFNSKATLLEDTQNEYKVEVAYENENVSITVLNLQKGETNFIHAARINDPLFADKISQTIQYPIAKYSPKKFTLSLSIMLLIFQQNKQKHQSNLLQIDQITTLSVPLPINYFIQPRFINSCNADALEKVKKKLYIYEIDINYNADYAAYTRLVKEEWLLKKWVSLRGANRLIWVDIGDIREKDGSFGVGFRIGCKEKDAQEAVDLIEYLCFMLAI